MEILERAKAILERERICNRCLGRCFAKFGSGLTNEERGQALRVMLSMIQNQGPRAPESCEICQGIFDSLDLWAERAMELAQDYEFKTYLMGTHLPLKIEEAEQALWQRNQIGRQQAEPIRQEFNREVGKRFRRALARLGRQVEVDFQEPEVVFLMDLERDRIDMQVNSLFIYGRYRKLIRGIPQTRWSCPRCRGHGCNYCNHIGKIYSESVEELITWPVLEEAQGEGHAFHGAGREDVDARMLGSGRPFVLEIASPRRRNLDLAALEQKINESAKGKVEVSGLRPVKGRVVEGIKRMDPQKSYQARVVFTREVTEPELKQALQQLVGEIEQRTPHRVSHRRADLLRRRRVFSAVGELTGPQEALIEIVCEGGLYVKELISGDEGRTHPSLSELLSTKAQVVELDVLEVCGDFP